MVSSSPIDTPRIGRGVGHGAAGLVAAAVVLLDAVLALIGVHSLVLTAGALLAPGLALADLLPGPVRRTTLPRLALMPALGLAASSVALISVARVGIPLTGVSIRVTLAVLVGAGLVLRARTRTEEEREPVDRRADVLELAVLLVILVVATLLAWKVVGPLPIPGNDWAKYLLYASEIADHHTLLLNNPYWLGGVDVPFREDPGVPALYGSALIMSHASAGALAQGILVPAVMLVLGAYGYTRAFLGRVAGLVAAAVVALVPASQNILGWHGLANLGALAFVALVLAQLGAWLARDLDRRGEAGLALMLVAVAAAHRFTSVMMVAVLGCVGLARLVLALRDGRADVRAAALSVVRILAWLVPFGVLVALDIRSRSKTAGGTLDYTSYLITKVDLRIVTRDLTWIVIALTGLSLIALIARRRLPRTVWPSVALGLVASVLGYVWVLHLPLYYARMVFYLPLAVAPVVGAGVAAAVGWVGGRVDGAVGGAGAARGAGAIGGRPGARAIDRRGVAFGALAVIAVVLAVFMASSASRQATRVRYYYAFSSTASLRGLDALAVDLRPGEPVTTDRCWSFLSAWLLRHPTYPALADQDIGPRAELPLARIGRSMIEGTRRGDRLVRKLGVRYALVDPNCPASDVPVIPKGNVVFESQRLAIVALDAAKR